VKSRTMPEDLLIGTLLCIAICSAPPSYAQQCAANCNLTQQETCPCGGGQTAYEDVVCSGFGQVSAPAGTGCLGTGHPPGDTSVNHTSPADESFRGSSTDWLFRIGPSESIFSAGGIVVDLFFFQGGG
jgi:hypothetical protein